MLYRLIWSSRNQHTARSPTTWDDVAEVARRSTKLDGGVVREGMNKPHRWTYFVMTLMSNGKASPKQAATEAERLLQVEVDKVGFKGTTL